MLLVLLFAAAAICFVLASFQSVAPTPSRINLVAFGLALLAIGFVVEAYP